LINNDKARKNKYLTYENSS